MAISSLACKSARVCRLRSTAAPCSLPRVSRNTVVKFQQPESAKASGLTQASLQHSRTQRAPAPICANGRYAIRDKLWPKFRKLSFSEAKAVHATRVAGRRHRFAVTVPSPSCQLLVVATLTCLTWQLRIGALDGTLCAWTRMRKGRLPDAGNPQCMLQDVEAIAAQFNDETARKSLKVSDVVVVCAAAVSPGIPPSRQAQEVQRPFGSHPSFLRADKLEQLAAEAMNKAVTSRKESVAEKVSRGKQGRLYEFTTTDSHADGRSTTSQAIACPFGGCMRRAVHSSRCRHMRCLPAMRTSALLPRPATVTSSYPRPPPLTSSPSSPPPPYRLQSFYEVARSLSSIDAATAHEDLPDTEALLAGTFGAYYSGSGSKTPAIPTAAKAHKPADFGESWVQGRKGRVNQGRGRCWLRGDAQGVDRQESAGRLGRLV